MKLEQYRIAANVTQEELAKALRVSKSNVSSWENGKRKIPTKHLIGIKDALHLTGAQLMDIVNEGAFSSNPSEIAKICQIHKDRNANEVSVPSGSGCMVPVITQAAAATVNPGVMPLLDCVNENSTEKTWFKAAHQGDFVIEVSGDSMTPWYPSGTLLLVRPFQRLQNGERVVAVLDDGEIVFKIFARTQKEIVLLSINHSDGKTYKYPLTGGGIRYICQVVASQRIEADLDVAMRESGIHHEWEDELKQIEKEEK